jgi:hypothetical protein
MKAFWILTLSVLTFVYAPARAQTSQQIRKMEAAGDTQGARTALARAAANNPTSVQALTDYAEFLDRYGDPGARSAYEKTLAALRSSGDHARVGEIARRLVILDLAAGDNQAASRELEAYRAATGRQVELGNSRSSAERSVERDMPMATIPGPLRSFARMAAISRDGRPEDILPALARNVVTNGFQASHSNDALEQTEYLKLVHRYLSQARELAKMAGAKKQIRIEKCESPAVGDLLRVLGFRMRGGCGSEVVLETVNAARAFLTTDSGFPVNELEQALRTDRPFTYDYESTAVPVLFGPNYWLGARDKSDQTADFIDTFLSDPSICRLYLGLSKLDPDTAESLRKGVSYSRLKVFAHVLDFYGGMFEIRDGKAIVPGGARTAAAWADLVGVSPDKGPEFFEKLIARDDGWMASMYDALARIHGPVQDYLTDPARLKRFYAAVKGKVTSPGPARPVFRSNTDMMLLTTRLQLEPNGKPHIPGGLDVWKNLFVNHPQGKYDGKLTRLATTWKDPDDLLEALFGLSRKAVENEPLKIFMAISDIDRNRTTPLAAATVDRLARSYRTYGAQYAIFNESRNLSDKSINQFLDTAEAINKVRDPLQKADVAGSFQSVIGLWQILVRQGTMPDGNANSTFSEIAGSFTGVKNDRELFDAGRSCVKILLASVPGPEAKPAEAQEQLVQLLAGGSTEDAETRDRMEQELGRILEAQRILSLDTLFQLADHLESLSKGEKLNVALVNKLAARISEIQLPRASLSTVEKNAIGYGYWTERHIENERKLNLRSAIVKAEGDPEKLKDIRGQMAPLLRDTLLALNYAYYAPPGAQILLTNPVFVRSHDFLGSQGVQHTWRPTEVSGSGWPSSGGGRLVGSLASLAYALAEAEQNFLIPVHTQALIWGDLVPQMMLSAKIPRWWNVTPSQVHWVGLHMRYGRELLGGAAFDPELRKEVLGALALYAPPVRTGRVGQLLEMGDVQEALNFVTPSELFSIARELAPKRKNDASAVLAEMKELAADSPKDVNYAAISRAFGTPKPTLANSYEPELLGLRTFPALMGYSSRIMAESWESNTLYWAALADELSLSPQQLNLRIPEWTEKLVEQIFASHLEDWPALLQSLRAVGDNVRASARAAMAAETKASLQEN